MEGEKRRGGSQAQNTAAPDKVTVEPMTSRSDAPKPRSHVTVLRYAFDSRLLPVLYSIINISDDQITDVVHHLTPPPALLHRVNKVDDFLGPF